MAQKFVNDWLEDVVRSKTPLVDALYSLRPPDLTRAVQGIRDFQGTKVMLSCTDRTPLAKLLKQALCFADLVIIVPAPLWVSCAHPGSHPYAEFNVESVGLASSCHFSAGLVKNLSRLIAEDADVFGDGAATFLPVLGESQHRWSHPEIDLREMPRPYSGDEGHHSPSSVNIEALYGLCSERLTAERLGVMHLNTASFTTPVFGDLTIGELPTGDWVHYLWKVDVPDLSFLPMTHVALIRRDLADAVSQFSRATMRVLGSGDVDGSTTKAMVGDLENSATALKKQMESTLAQFATSTRLPKTTVVLGSGGPQGGISPTVDFLLRGGTLTNLKRLITVSGNEKPELRQDSFWATRF
jgi:hypothetical protein